jgi:hypothetical protein
VKSLCVFCGSSEGRDPAFADAARALGRELAVRGVGLVYGGGNVGLMGVIADAALEAGGRVTGVIPRPLVDREVAHAGLTDLRVVGSMHERKALMAELADGFIAMPGGFGTLEEIAEAITWTQLGVHVKPCGLLNTAGFYDGLLAFVAHANDERFIKASNRDIVLADTDPVRLLDRLDAWQPPDLRVWVRQSQT